MLNTSIFDLKLTTMLWSFATFLDFDIPYDHIKSVPPFEVTVTSSPHSEHDKLKGRNLPPLCKRDCSLPWIMRESSSL